MSSTRQTMAKLLKDFYLPGLRNTLNNTIFLLSQVEQNSDKVEGLEVVQSIRLGRNQGIGARAESGDLPAAGRSKVRQVRSWLKYNYGSLEFSGPLLRSAVSDRGSFARPIESETRGIVVDLKNDVNRQLYGTGTGAIAAVTGANTAASLPVTPTLAQSLQLAPGMKVDVGPLTGAMKAVGATIVSVSASAVVLDAAPGSATAAGDYIFRAGNRDNELTGLTKIVATSGALYGIDPAVDPEWKSPVLSLGGVITEAAYGRVWKGVHLRSGEEPNLIITTAGIHQDTANLLTSLKRFPNTNKLKGGYTGLDMGMAAQGKSAGTEVTLVYDKDCPAGEAFVLTTARLQWQRASDWEFMDEDGDMLSRVAGKDAYGATLFVYADIVTDNRGAHGRITGITENAAQPVGTWLDDAPEAPAEGADAPDGGTDVDVTVGGKKK